MNRKNTSKIFVAFHTNSRLFIGGNDVREDMRKLLEGVHVVVGTSGRLAHLLRLKALQTNSVRLFVLDEADKLMERRYREDIKLENFQLLHTKYFARMPSTDSILTFHDFHRKFGESIIPMHSSWAFRRHLEMGSFSFLKS